MSTPISFNGVAYSVPSALETDWEELSEYLIAISTGTFQRSGGSFVLTADADFGANFGPKVAYLKSRATNIADAGLIRLANTDTIGFRNNANDGNLLLSVSATDKLQFGGVDVSSSADLTLKANIDSPTFTGTVGGITAAMVGLGNVDNTSDASKPVSTAQQTALNLKANLASPTFTGTVTLPTGTVTSAMIADGAIVDADINAAAAIAGTKISPAFGSQNISTTGTLASGAAIIGGASNASATDNIVYGKSLLISSTSSSGVRHSFTSGATNGRTFQIGHNFVTGAGEFSIFDSTAGGERLSISTIGAVTLGTANGTAAHIANTSQFVIRGASTGGVDPELKFDADGANAFRIRATAADTLQFVDAAGTTVYGSIAPGGGVTFGHTTAGGGSHVLQANVSSGNITVIRNLNTSTSPDNSAALIIGKGSATTTAGSQRFVNFEINASAALSGYIGSNGANAAAFFSTSDRRLKTDIADLSGGLSTVLAMRPVNFKWKQDGSAATGFIAQELAAVAPQFVCQTDSGEGEDLPDGQTPWNMTESGMSAYLVKAIQELKVSLDALDKKIEGRS